jgi:hypothetical protein
MEVRYPNSPSKMKVMPKYGKEDLFRGQTSRFPPSMVEPWRTTKPNKYQTLVPAIFISNGTAVIR